MSTEANICVRLQEALVPSVFIKALTDSGWGKDLDGSVSILSPNHFETGDWEILSGLQISDILQWVGTLDNVQGGFGLLLVHQPTEIGGTLSISRDRLALDWGISVNIPHISSERILVDFSKCITLLWPAICAAHLRVRRIEMYSE